MPRRAKVSDELDAAAVPVAADVEPRVFDRDVVGPLCRQDDRVGYAPAPRTFPGIKTHLGPLALKRQVSIALPLEDWKLLRLEAARRRVSTTELCRQQFEPLLEELRDKS